MEVITEAIVKQLQEALEPVIEKKTVLNDLATYAETNKNQFHQTLLTVLGWWKPSDVPETQLKVDVHGTNIPDGPYFKVLNPDFVQKKFKYQLGLNVDTIPFNPTGSGKPGGLYFATATNLPAFFNRGTVIVQVTIPDDAKVHVESSKIKADKIIISNPINIKDWPYWLDQKYCLRIIKKYPSTAKYMRSTTEALDMELVKTDIGYIDQIPLERRTDRVWAVVLSQDGEYIKKVVDPSEYLCLIAVKKSSKALSMIKNPTDKVIVEALAYSNKACKFLREPISNNVFRFILNNDKLRYIECNLSEEHELMAIEATVLNFRHLKNPSARSIKAALQNDGNLIGCIKTYTEEMAKIAIERNPDAIKYISLQTEELCKLAVSKDGMVLEHIKYPTNDVILAAVDQNPSAIQFITEKNTAITTEALRRNGMLLQVLDQKTLTDEMIAVALTQNGHAIQFIEDPKEWQQKIAITNKYTSVEYIGNKLTPAMKEYAEQLRHEAETQITV